MEEEIWSPKVLSERTHSQESTSDTPLLSQVSSRKSIVERRDENNRSVRVGASAMETQPLAPGAVAIGYETLKNVWNLNHECSAVGYMALSALKSGHRNTALGHLSQGYNEYGSNNTTLGYQAGAHSCGTDNIALGVYAMLSNELGCHNIACGTLALSLALNVNRCYAWGTQALASLLRGEDNLVMGFNACQAATEVSRVFGLGHQTLEHNQVSEIMALGYQALQHQVSGLYNQGMGFQALQHNMIGSHNTASGYRSLQQAGGSHNTALGDHIMCEVFSTGSENVLQGSEVYRRGQGSRNVMQGCRAGQQLEISQSNVLLGYESGATSKTGDYHTCLGYRTGFAADLSHALCLGAGAVATETGQMVVGSPEFPIQLRQTNTGAWYLPLTINGRKFRMPLEEEEVST